MNRFPLIAVAIALIAIGCQADFKATGFTFNPGGGQEDTGGQEDVIAPAEDTVPDVPEGPKICDDLWMCVLDNGCALAPEIDDSVCLKKCAGDQMDQHVIKFKALKECAAAACATEPTGDAMIQCAYQYCTNEWFSCVSDGGGEKTCGDMHHCLIGDCDLENPSAQCVSNCLRDGDLEADQWLSLMVACANSVFYVASPLECAGAMAGCYAGSDGGEKPCRHALMCELVCYEQICPDDSFCNIADLVYCSYDCLRGLQKSEMERMYAIQQCIIELSHKKLVEDDYNIYSYCALQAHECLGKQDQFTSCGQAFGCLKDRYNHFPSIVGEPPSPFWMVVQDCLVDVVHADKEPLSAALWCLHENYEGPAIDLVAPWNECKDFCE